jgi:hypothetical protein
MDERAPAALLAGRPQHTKKKTPRVPTQGVFALFQNAD